MKSIYLFRPDAATIRRVLWVPTDCAAIYYRPECDRGIAVDERCCVCECRPCCCDLFDPQNLLGQLEARIKIAACGDTEFIVPMNLNDPPGFIPNACVEYIGNLQDACPGCTAGLTFFFACAPPFGQVCLGCEDLLLGIDVEPDAFCLDSPTVGPSDCECNDGDPDEPFWAQFFGEIVPRPGAPAAGCDCGQVEVLITEPGAAVAAAARYRMPATERRRCREDVEDRKRYAARRAAKDRAVQPG